MTSHIIVFNPLLVMFINCILSVITFSSHIHSVVMVNKYFFIPLASFEYKAQVLKVRSSRFWYVSMVQNVINLV